MKDTITNKLMDIERKHNIKMLFACESGSRGWGFPSPDSDYDARFIYLQAFQNYVSIVDHDDQLKFPINYELDIYGWDLRKVLQLIRKSNTTPFEWLQSPIIYLEENGFRESLWAICGSYYNQRGNIHHYLGIARGAMETIVNDDEIKIKKLFYVLRPLFSAMWCLDRNTIAPMTIGPLMTLLPRQICNIVSELITLKADSPEGFMIKIDPTLRKFIDDEFERCNQQSANLERQSFGSEELDAFFFKMITTYDDKRS